MTLKYFQLNRMCNWFTYERISLISLTLLSVVANPTPVLRRWLNLFPLFSVSLNEVPCVASVRPDSCARVSLSKSSSKQRIRQRWGAAPAGQVAALLGGAEPRVRSGSPFYCTACSPGCCPPRVWWMTTTLVEPVNTHDNTVNICSHFCSAFIRAKFSQTAVLSL